jgi:hypothetical protein
MAKLPQNKKWIQTNRSDFLGNLRGTFNIDLQSNIGAVRVSPRMKLNTGSLNACPVAIERFGQRIYAVAGTTIYRNTNDSGLPSDAFVADTSTSASTDYSSDYSDLKSAWNTLFATAPTKLRSLSSPNGGTWTDRATISSGLSHRLCYFPKYDRLYFTDQTIKSITEAFSVSTSGDYTLSGVNTFGITDMKSTSNFIWISGKTETTKDDEGAV